MTPLEKVNAARKIRLHRARVKMDAQMRELAAYRREHKPLARGFVRLEIDRLLTPKERDEHWVAHIEALHREPLHYSLNMDPRCSAIRGDDEERERFTRALGEMMGQALCDAMAQHWKHGL